jgi:hypothetical protein
LSAHLTQLPADSTFKQLGHMSAFLLFPSVSSLSFFFVFFSTLFFFFAGEAVVEVVEVEEDEEDGFLGGNPQPNKSQWNTQY